MERSKHSYNLIWKHTHRDFKGKVDGVRTIMIYRNGSTLVRLEDLTDAEFARQLASAIRQEEQKYQQQVAL